jgi:hypothetical protein
MVTKQLSIAIAISICIGSGIALETFAAASASATRIDFDQVFADVTRQSAGYVDRARKSDRLFSRPFCRNLQCSPSASHWHPSSPIRSWAALLVAATHSVPASLAISRFNRFVAENHGLNSIA